MTSQEYYNDPALWGSGKYISLKELVSDYMDSLVGDDYTVNTERRHVINLARKAIRRFTFSSIKEFSRIELDLSTSLQITLPIDYVDYYRISWVDSEGILYPMAKNERLSMASTILQDHEYNYLCDSDGNILTAKGIRQTEQSVLDYQSGPNEDLSQVYENGSFNIDDDCGVIQFDSNAKTKTIVLEYITDGFSGKKDSEIKINKLAAEAVNNFIYHALVRRNKNVSASEKRRARKDLLISVSRMNNQINRVRIEDVMQILRGKSKWVK